MITWLLDTGPLVAYLVADDPKHAEASSVLGGFNGLLCTSGAVIAEAMYFVMSNSDGPERLSGFIYAADVQVYDLAQPASLREAAVLMRTYADTPMDYADATLVLLAEHLDAAHIATLDRRGFSAYRTRDGRALVNVLDLH